MIFNEFKTLRDSLFLGKTYISGKIDLDKIVSEIKTVLKENDKGTDRGLILEIFSETENDKNKSTLIFFYKNNYLVQEFNDFSCLKFNENKLISMYDGFYKNEFDESFIDSLVKKLIKNKRNITSMESCTSGMVANLVTNTEGASSILKGAYVTYSNEAKVMAGVDKDLIDCFGVYSIETADAMAYNSKLDFKANIGIGVTGTTGNVDPANGDSIQGEIYYTIDSDNGVAHCKLRLDTNGLSRKQIKEIICGNIFRSLSLSEGI